MGSGVSRYAKKNGGWGGSCSKKGSQGNLQDARGPGLGRFCVLDCLFLSVLCFCVSLCLPAFFCTAVIFQGLCISQHKDMVSVGVPGFRMSSVNACSIWKWWGCGLRSCQKCSPHCISVKQLPIKTPGCQHMFPQHASYSVDTLAMWLKYLPII